MKNEELFSWVRERYPRAMVAAVMRDGDVVTIESARPGLLIGKNGVEADALEAALRRHLATSTIVLTIVELRRPELEPVLVADDVAKNLSFEMPPERAVDRPVDRSLKAGARFCRIVVVGAVERTTERGTLDEATLTSATTTKVIELPYEEDDDGNEIVREPRPGPRPSVTVTVSICGPAASDDDDENENDEDGEADEEAAAGDT